MIRDLAKKALELRSKGYSTEEIADILNVHPDTVMYLLAGAISSRPIEEQKRPKETLDVYVDRSTIARNPAILDKLAEGAAIYLRDLIDNAKLEEPDVIVGFNSDGFAVAIAIAKAMTKPVGYVDMRLASPSIDPTFSDVVDKKILLVDDVISSGIMLERVINALRDVGGIPIGIFVLVNKSGKNEILGVPIFSLLEVRIL